MITLDASGRGHSEVLPEEDPVLDGVEARFAMSEAGLSQIMRMAGTAPAQTGHDIMSFLASMTAHREENPHVDTPPPQTDPYADARTASMVASSVAAVSAAVGSIAAGASSSGGGASALPSAAASVPASSEAPPPESSSSTSATSTETPTETSTSSESPPPVAETSSSTVSTTRRSAPRDSDGDGVRDRRDRCADTPEGTDVDEHGCPPAADPEPEPEPDPEESPEPAVSYTSPVPPPVMPCDPSMETCDSSVIEMGNAALDTLSPAEESALANAGLLESHA